MSRKYTFSDDDLRQAVLSSISVNGVLKWLKVRACCGNWRTVKKRMVDVGIDTSHFKGKSHMKGKRNEKVPTRPLLEVLVRDSSYTNMSCMKRRMLQEGILKNECALCGQGPEWKGNPLVLVLDHINGINNDHRRVNLRMLCPNCNSQQGTFAGRNAGKHP